MDHDSPNDEGALVDTLTSVREHLMRVTRLFEAEARRLETEGVTPETAKAGRQISGALQSYVDERHRVEKLIDGFGEQVGSNIIDLAAAELEIESRLDSLARAQREA